MKLRSLAVIVNSFAELDVINPTLLGITREILLNQVDQKAEHLTSVQDLQPIDCAQFMTAYCRANMFSEVVLFEALEAQFLRRIDEVEGTTIVTMFCAHASWANHLIDECLIKKK